MEDLFKYHLLEPLMSIVRLAIWLAILVVIFVPMERFFSAHPKQIFRKQALVDIAYFFLNSLFPALLLAAPVAFLAASIHYIVPGAFLGAIAALPLWSRVFAAMLAGELGYYWSHRLCHEIPFLWRFHAIHHSAEEMDFLVNTRAHPVDMVFGRFCGLVPIYVLGLGGPIGSQGSLVPVVVTLIGTVWGFFIHANVCWRFGPLEWLISTPAFHHWHHTLTGPINRNYASTFPWVDRLFGTHYLPDSLPTSYGIEGKVPASLIDQLAYPLDAQLRGVAVPEAVAVTISNTG